MQHAQQGGDATIKQLDVGRELALLERRQFIVSVSLQLVSVLVLTLSLLETRFRRLGLDGDFSILRCITHLLIAFCLVFCSFLVLAFFIFIFILVLVTR